VTAALDRDVRVRLETDRAHIGCRFSGRGGAARMLCNLEYAQ
jgi:hypothetical protein